MSGNCALTTKYVLENNIDIDSNVSSLLNRTEVLIDHTTQLVVQNFTSTKMDFLQRHYLLPALVSSVYCQSSIYIESCFNSFDHGTKSSTFNGWYERNFEKLKSQAGFSALSDAYLINQFRHLVIVHGEVNVSAGHTASSDGSFEIWFGSEYILEQEEVNKELKLVLDLLTPLENKKIPGVATALSAIRSCQRNLMPYDHAVDILFRNLTANFHPELSSARIQVNNLVQRIGCNSSPLKNILNTIDAFLPAYHSSI
ncbi:MAG: hypothetical protein V4598_05720 [Bdellovibrionota bacterium]